MLKLYIDVNIVSFILYMLTICIQYLSLEFWSILVWLQEDKQKPHWE